MKGAIAAGHPLTAEAGAHVLAEGGNAVDACIAAGFASWVTESPLTGPGAGGFMLVHRARDRSTRVLDFFVAVPGLGLEPGHVREMEAVDVDFTPESSQVFRIGAASCAVPGTVAGLESAHRSFGSLPWRRLVEPAISLAREGVEVTRAQAYLHAILDSILRHTPESRAIYERSGDRLVAGDRLEMPELAKTLELIAREGAAALYEGKLARALVRHVRARGGAITEADLAQYRVIRRRPITTRYRRHEFRSNPPPSTGGILIAYALHLLDRVKRSGPPGSAEAMALLADVMRAQNRARARRFMTDLYRGGLARRLFADKAIAEALARLREREPMLAEIGGPSGTTHISVVDARGNAAALTASTGSGSGVVVPGTGIHLNNMLGEFDLGPVGRGLRPGIRFTSMMAPSLALRPDGSARLVVGSAGSLRLRGAILQIVVNVLGHDLPVDEAIDRPRVHLEEPHLHCEGGADPEELARLEEWGYDVVRWRRRNLYFGGAAGVELGADGTLAAAGDARRGGHGIVVQ
jgi:gamma-glutamyltranspeptidase/glutathione hydrolase